MKSQNEDMEIRMRERQGYITVIVPVYNVEKYLDRCMESILHRPIRSWRSYW